VNESTTNGPTVFILGNWVHDEILEMVELYRWYVEIHIGDNSDTSFRFYQTNPIISWDSEPRPSQNVGIYLLVASIIIMMQTKIQLFFVHVGSSTAKGNELVGRNFTCSPDGSNLRPIVEGIGTTIFPIPKPEIPLPIQASFHELIWTVGMTRPSSLKV